jgi:DNA-binding response OmpR family regulator
MSRFVILVDDDMIATSFYVRALERSGFAVKQFFGPDTAFEYIDDKNPEVAAIIMDIMMLPGNRYTSVDTKDGLRTGVFMARDFREFYPQVPIIVLTNVSNQETLRLFDESSLLKVVQKLEYPPFELVQLVKDMIEGSHS